MSTQILCIEDDEDIALAISMLAGAAHAGAAGCAMSFGPGMVAETMMFQTLN
jgi:predicted naringenin-chalcone synthase